MKFEDSYFEDEVREGFYVPSMVKRAWAAELEVLSEIDRICKKYDIPYFADWGSLLGAVRHGGFIPWDDDMDISMKRADYNRFMEVARVELPDGFGVYNYRENEDYWNFVTRVVGKRRICFEEEHLRRFHGFPYIVGVDIFLLDYVCRDEEREHQRVTICNYILAIADGMAEGKIAGVAAEEGIKKIENICGIEIDRSQSMNQLRVQLYDQVVKFFSMFTEEESDYLTRMMPDGINGNRKLRLPKRYYDDMLWMPFENIEIPVPIAYDEMLTRRYGNYMRIIKDAGGHDYPFFEAQRKKLQKVLDFDMPHFKFSKEYLNKKRIGKEHSLKNIAEEYQKNAALLVNKIGCKLDEINKGNVSELLQLLTDTQQYAIDFAGAVERCKGKETETVSGLEQYCENLYQVYMNISHGEAYKEGNNSLHVIINELKHMVSEINNKIDEEIMKRKEMVFMPFKALYWNAMKSVYETELQDERCDVFVIPTPYYYKEYDGELVNKQYEWDFFSEHVKITNYEDYDFALHSPETIVIQNPYDEWNEAISVSKEFYSANLKQYTDKLLYIPYFKVDEFSKDNYREYRNMQSYCTMPGVIYADQIIVQSENMKNLYIEKLVEFAGEETRSVWEKKILGIDTLSDCCTENEIEWDETKQDQTKSIHIPSEWKKIIYREDGTKKKVILFHVEACSLIQYKERFLEKLKAVLNLLQAHQENIALIWSVDEKTNQILHELGKRFVSEYEEVLCNYQKNTNGIFISDFLQEQQAVDISDA